jgi:AraC-like DNA-binding protein
MHSLVAGVEDSSSKPDANMALALRLAAQMRTTCTAGSTNFQQILDEIRFEAACQLLDKTQLPITDIAGSLGYSESSAFTRAFRRWSGAAPSRRRQTELRDSLSA